MKTNGETKTFVPTHNPVTKFSTVHNTCARLGVSKLSLKLKSCGAVCSDDVRSDETKIDFELRWHGTLL